MGCGRVPLGLYGGGLITQAAQVIRKWKVGNSPEFFYIPCVCVCRVSVDTMGTTTLPGGDECTHTKNLSRH